MNTVTAKLMHGGAPYTQSLRCAATGGEFTLIAGGNAIAVAAATTATELGSLLNTALASQGFTISVSIVNVNGDAAEGVSRCILFPNAKLDGKRI